MRECVCVCVCAKTHVLASVGLWCVHMLACVCVCMCLCLCVLLSVHWQLHTWQMTGLQRYRRVQTQPARVPHPFQGRARTCTPQKHTMQHHFPSNDGFFARFPPPFFFFILPKTTVSRVAALYSMGYGNHHHHHHHHHHYHRWQHTTGAWMGQLLAR